MRMSRAAAFVEESESNIDMTTGRSAPSRIVVCAGALIFIAVFFCQGIFFIRANAPTYDEAMHLAAGYSYLAIGDFHLEPQNPPLIKTLMAAPLFFDYRIPFPTHTKHWRDSAAYLLGQSLVFHSPLPANHVMLLGRLPNLFLGAVLVALIGWWAYRLWGGGAALIAVALACLEPNLLAHSSLITTDVGVSLLVFLAVYLLWEHSHHRSYWLVAAAGLALGVALVSKFSAILFVPIVAALVALAHFVHGTERALPTRLREIVGALFLVIVSAAVLIPPAYFFQGFGPWVSGLRTFLNLAQEGQPAFFLGKISYEGFWAYYPMAFLIKTPIGTLLLITASLIFCRSGRPLWRSDALFLLLPVVVVFLAMTQAKVNIGLRHILPVYPFLLVLAGRVATMDRSLRWMIAAPLIFTAVSVLRVAPHQLAYFNEFIGGPGHGYRYLTDSNLDWGQDLKGVKEYIEKEKLPIIYLSYFGTAPPAYYGIRYQYVPGAWPLEWPPPIDKVPGDAPRKILAISASNLYDVATAYDPLFRWLQTRRPIEKIGYSIFIYDLTDDREGLAKLEETYFKAGIRPP
jgi:hypothetical protein